VTTLRTLVFAEPDIKSPLLFGLPLGAGVTVVDEAEDRNARYALLASGGAVVVQHLAPLGSFERDWTAVAERLLGVPYLWGGKTSLGIDCSGLVQVALAACGIGCPRDTDMQAEAAGAPLPLDAGIENLRRGDLVFWTGHVGIMRNETILLHANAHHMQVASEPLLEAAERFAGRGLTVTGLRRPVAD
jgi:cell wall-associated NlpC family hydrolase